MIGSLTIQNYALIESLEMTPSKGLSVLTGETGAGKSIILGAIGLLLGKRADTKVLYDESKKCIVEATLQIREYNLSALFEELEVDYEEECIIRREISPNGKSRAFVNDSPVTLDVLKSIGPHLMDIHSQHESLDLGKNTYQLSTLDFFAQHDELLNQQRTLFKTYNKLKTDLDNTRNKAQKNAQDLDYQQFILKELEEADLKEGEEEDLKQELEILENAEEIKERLSASSYLLDESEVAILSQIQKLNTQISKVAGFNSELEKVNTRLQESAIELRDVYSEIVDINDRILHDPQRLQQARERLDLIYRLQQKHGQSDISGLISLHEQLAKELNEIGNLDEVVAKLQKEVQAAQEQMLKAGKALTKSRLKAAGELSSALEEVIKTIGIENGQIDIRIEEASPSSAGCDQVEFWFSANKGLAMKEMKSVASGGELSRLIFGLKYLIADKTSLPTIVFDEIDTGVSGEIAIQMVKLMQKMASNHQVISISHLPQFAAGADHHYMVFKDHSSAKSVSKVKLLPQEERVALIASMIGGQSPSETAKNNAQELLSELSN